MPRVGDRRPEPRRYGPEDAARHCLNELRQELGWPVNFMRTVAGLPEEQRQVLRDVTRAALANRRAIEDAESQR